MNHRIHRGDQKNLEWPDDPKLIKFDRSNKFLFIYLLNTIYNKKIILCTASKLIKLYVLIYR